MVLLALKIVLEMLMILMALRVVLGHLTELRMGFSVVFGAVVMTCPENLLKSQEGNQGWKTDGDRF